MTNQSYVCSSCGKEHEGLPTDWGFTLPDEAFELSFLQKYRRVRCNDDLCTLDESRHFVRGLLSLPFNYQPGSFSWGVWIELDKATHDFYVEHFNDDVSAHARVPGTLANDLPGYGAGLGQHIEMEFQPGNARPLFYLQDSTNQLAIDQESGISADRHHALLDACGYFTETAA